MAGRERRIGARIAGIERNRALQQRACPMQLLGWPASQQPGQRMMSAQEMVIGIPAGGRFRQCAARFGI
jgi:hypothetical protein